MSLDDIDYFDPIYKSWAVELTAALREQREDVPLGHSLDIVAALFQYSSYNHLANQRPHIGATIPEDFAPDWNNAEKMAEKRQAPVASVMKLLRQLCAEEKSARIALAKRLARVVERNCEYVCGEYCHPAVMTIEDAELCQEITESPIFVDFLYGPYPFTARQSFASIKPDPSWGGHFIVNADAALNVAAYLFPNSLGILSAKHKRS